MMKFTPLFCLILSSSLLQQSYAESTYTEHHDKKNTDSIIDTEQLAHKLASTKNGKNSTVSKAEVQQLVEHEGTAPTIIDDTPPLMPERTPIFNNQDDSRINPTRFNTEKPVWEIGLIGLSVQQQAYTGASYSVNKSIVVPTLVYRSKSLIAEAGNVRLKAFVSPNYEIDVGFAASLGSSATQGARQGLPKIGFLAEAGPRLTVHLAREDNTNVYVEVPLRVVVDINRQLKYSGLSLKPTLIADYKKNDWELSGSVGALFGDARRNELLYGVDDIYATNTRPAYTAKAGLVAWRASTSLGLQMTPDLRLFSFLQYDLLNGAANRHSPLVEKNTALSFGLGAHYTWLKSKDTVQTR